MTGDRGVRIKELKKLLTAEQKEYIRRNYHNMTAYKMAKVIGKDPDSVKHFMKQEKLTPLKPHRDTIGFTCAPPQSCFNCPFSDCIRDVRVVKQTSKEIEYHALGDIDTVGQGNGRKRI